MKKVGILGGTFDPPHIGHLLIAEQVREAFSLEEIWFIPSNEPPHKEKASTNAFNRLNMLQLALKDHQAFKINEIELNRQGKSYTIDTVKTLQDQYPMVDFYFIIGADMVDYLPYWHKIDELLQRITFIGVSRPGYRLDSPYEILRLQMPMIDISSTLLRERLQQKRTVRYLIPEAVRSYIKEQDLYEMDGFRKES